MTSHWLSDLGMLTRLTRDIRSFLQAPVTVEQAGGIVKQRLAMREERFLTMAGQAIFKRPRSPYLRLLRAAGCELGDFKSLVDREGLDGALSRLVEDGVYVTFDEFKGRKEAVRGSQRFSFFEEDFDNPSVSPHVEARSGGTRSAGTSVKIHFSYLGELAVNTALTLHSHGFSKHDHVIWLHEGFSALIPMLIYAKLGRLPIAWFYPLKPLPLKAHVASRYLILLGRLLGYFFPTPVFLDLRDPGTMAMWLANYLNKKKGRSVCVTTYASSAVRIAAAAHEKGISLDGVCFITLGEPFTDAKQKTIEAAGARSLVRYAHTQGWGRCRSTSLAPRSVFHRVQRDVRWKSDWVRLWLRRWIYRRLLRRQNLQLDRGLQGKQTITEANIEIEPFPYEKACVGKDLKSSSPV